MDIFPSDKELLRMGLRVSNVSTIVSTGSVCSRNCSGHGQCERGQCVCLVQYTGENCGTANYDYYTAFGAIFATLCLVAIIQLLLCMRSEYIKEKKYSVRAACKVTTQKLLYFLTVCATALRGSYFFSRWHVPELVSSGLWSAYYPFLLTGFSLIVCFWAEAFHLEGFVGNKPRFLNKSVFWFSLFNIFIYLLLLGQLVAVDIIKDDNSSEIITRACTGCFSLLILIVVILFLIYGIEVFFKVHGAFTESTSMIDTWQLHMSRTGLLALAFLQLITALFLASDAISWKDRLPILSQNLYEIVFRIVEFGVALWFPCVLWNCNRPEQLWVLNPRRLFKNLEIGGRETGHTLDKDIDREARRDYGSLGEADNVKYDCWICYDPERSDVGSLIQPCSCTGDVATVHHDCLKKWLLECVDGDLDLACKVCGEKYKLSSGWITLPMVLKKRHWLQTFLVLIIMVGCPLVAYSVDHSGVGSPVLILTIGLTTLIELACLRILWQSLFSFFHHVRVSSMKILGKIVGSSSKTTI
ncbi:hypothetical protein ScPMuIL_010011 [Solemya velum]